MLMTGAGGFALQLFDTLTELNLENEIVFFDESSGNANRLIYDRFRVISSLDAALEHLKNDSRFILGTGNPVTRKMFYEKFTAVGAVAATIISPSAFIGKYHVTIGEGATILRNVTIESNVTIGIGCLINLGATVTHGCVLGDFCEVCPAVNLSGNVQIGEGSFLGTGAVFLPKITVGKDCVIAAGAVVTKDIADGSMAAGVPAIVKKIR
jgi:sugar O-acyltransferase (sialic acid O-acetyltransferase NeuD family)